MAHRTDLSPGEILLDTYEVLDLVGRGGMGAVYRVFHRYLKKEMAMKTMRGEQVTATAWRRFQAEAQALARLVHPNIVQIFDMGTLENGQLYYTMEFLSGRSLDALITELAPVQVLEIFRCVALALAFAHERGIIHRDIKPANIVVTVAAMGPAQVKVVDFGIAKLLSGEQGLTKTGEVFGSPFYMSPEQGLGLKVDARSDIYSLGCAFYEALTGSVPFKGKNAMDTLTLHQQRRPLPIAALCPERDFPCGLWEVLEKMLAKEPEERYESAGQVAQDLLLVIKGQGARALERLEKEARRKASETTGSARCAIENRPGYVGVAGDDGEKLRDGRYLHYLPLKKRSLQAAVSLFLLALGGWGWSTISGVTDNRQSAQPFENGKRMSKEDILSGQLDHYKLAGAELERLRLGLAETKGFDYYLFPSNPAFSIGKLGGCAPETPGVRSVTAPCLGLQKLPAGYKVMLAMSSYLAWHPELWRRFDKGELVAVDLPYQQRTRNKNAGGEDFPSYRDAGATMKVLQALKPISHLAFLNTADACLDGKCLSELSRFSHLRQLDMAGSKIFLEEGNLSLLTLRELETLTLPAMGQVAGLLNRLTVPEKLNSLTIDEFLSTEENIKAVARLKKLAYLSLLDSRLELPFLKELVAREELGCFNFTGSYIAPEAIPVLLQIRKNQTLVISADLKRVWGAEKFADFQKNFAGTLEINSERIEPFLEGN